MDLTSLQQPRSIARRDFLRAAGAAAAAVAAGAAARAASGDAAATTATTSPAAAAAAGERLVKFPEKVPLICNTDRPPNLETPLAYFQHDLTPNEAMYVRWHLGITPTRVDTAAFRLNLGGHVERPLQLTLEQLRNDYERVSVVAVNQCSGNSRRYFEPRMPGVQWGNGALANARWTGVRLKDLLSKAGIKAGALDVSFDGLDGPTLPAAEKFQGTPDFIKALAVDRANDGEVMVAYEVNDQPLPMLNGFPLRLVVPGWYATYWVKALHQINVLDKRFDGFWVAKAYRVPPTKNYRESPKDLAKETTPITTMTVRSLFVRPAPQERVAATQPYEVQGIALDGGNGIRRVELSIDDGASWREARLDRDMGKYSWRRWRFDWRPPRGRHRLLVRATNNAGDTQTSEPQWNRSGYARNVIESLEVEAV
jgi:DMSO/TMAO reductase YedYZ molybdopterin-dependent catalytic subunit